jgi:hypothetical protein
MSPDDSPPIADDVSDGRLYATDSDGWEAQIKRDSEKVYCYQKHPGEDYFHQILNTEVYLANGYEKLCLRCALRLGVLTPDRLFWQHRVRNRQPPTV